MEDQNLGEGGKEQPAESSRNSPEAVAVAGMVPCLCDCKSVALIPRVEDGDVTGWQPVCPRCERHGAVATGRQLAMDLWNIWTTRARSYDALYEALKPFAELDIAHFETKSDDRPIFGLNATIFTVGDVRRARAALALATTT